VTYLVLRDTVRGRQPTQWHFWTFSEKLVPAIQPTARAAALAKKPGPAKAPLRELKGNRFTAIGQWDVDLEYFVASPRTTPRYTLRYGYRNNLYGARAHPEYQDLLHLQLPGDGSYVVAMFPRDAKAAAPKFESLCDGRVIKVAGPFGADYCFLSNGPAEASTGDVSFAGTAGAVLGRSGYTELVLAAAGEVRGGGYGLAAAFPVSARVEKKSVRLTFKEGFAGGEVTIRAAKGVSLKLPAGPKTAMKRTDQRHALVVPAGTRSLVLQAQ